MEVDNLPKYKKVLSYLVFLLALTVTLISLISVVFPALIPRLTSSIGQSSINPFEPGIWATHLLATNIILLGIGILYYTKNLPTIIVKSIGFVLNFEISSKIAFIVIAILLSIYIGFSISELATEEDWPDYAGAKAQAEKGIIENLVNHFNIKYSLLSFSLIILHNIRIIPFIVSILLLLVTYFFTVKITKKKFAGIVSMITLLQSHIFLEYDTTAAYENSWTFFYVLSLYCIYKKWYLSPLAFIASVYAKGLSILFLPLSIFSIYQSDLSRNKKIQTIVIYGIIVIVGAIFIISNFTIGIPEINFDYYDFWSGFTLLPNHLRFEGFLILFLLPLIMGLFMLSKRGILAADSLMVLIMGMLLHAPLLAGFTIYTNHPYRFVPLIVFFAIGVGTIFSKRIKT